MKRLRSDLVFVLACLAAPAIGWLFSAAALGDSFTWQNINGADFITPARNQGAMGSCWSFSAVETLEAKYMLTRNDPTFDIYLAEQNLICDIYQTGGPPGAATNPFETGICTDAELPYTATTYSPLYPLQSGWQQRFVVATQEALAACRARHCQREGRVEGLWPAGHRYLLRRSGQPDLGHRRRRPRRLGGGLRGRPGVGRRRLLDRQEQLGHQPQRGLLLHRLRQRDPAGRHPGIGRRDGLLYRHHVFQRQRLQQSGQFAHRDRRHGHVERGPQ